MVLILKIFIELQVLYTLNEMLISINLNLSFKGFCYKFKLLHCLLMDFIQTKTVR